MRKIYIVLTYTGTALSKLIRFYTRKEYSHVSISLDENLEHMYSFGRLNPYIPFIGGFVQESPKYGTFKRFSRTKTKIYSMEIDDYQYKKIKKIIKKFLNNKQNYKFNVVGLFAIPFHLKIERKNYFYCAEFVKFLFDNTNLQINLPDIVKPNDFQNIFEFTEIYSGKLQEYKM